MISKDHRSLKLCIILNIFSLFAENEFPVKRIKLKLKYKVSVTVDLTNPDNNVEVKRQAYLQVNIIGSLKYFV